MIIIQIKIMIKYLFILLKIKTLIYLGVQLKKTKKNLKLNLIMYNHKKI